MKNRIFFFFLILIIFPIVSADQETVFQPGDLQTVFSYEGDIQGYFLPTYFPTPKITIVNPTGDVITSSTMVLYVVLSEPGTCTYAIDSGANVSFPNIDNKNFIATITTPTPDGNYLFRFNCVDLLGTHAYNSTVITVTQTVPAPPVDDGGGGGGGGGGATNETTPAADNFTFTVDPDFFKVELKVGDNIVYFANVRNIGNKKININTQSSEFLNYFLVLGETNFSLNPGETKRVSFGFFARDGSSANLYTESVDFISNNQRKRVNVILDVKEKNPLFDVLVKAPNKGYIGENVAADIEVFNMGDLEGFDLLMDYSILDLDGAVIDFKEESLYIEKNLNFRKSLFLNKNVKPGQYLFYANVSYGNITARGSDLFTVKYRKGLYVYYILVGLIVLIFLRVFQIAYKKNKGPASENAAALSAPRLPFFKRIFRGLTVFLGFKKL